MKKSKFLNTYLDKEDTVIVNAIEYKELLLENEQLSKNIKTLNASNQYLELQNDAIGRECAELKSDLKVMTKKHVAEITEHKLTRAKLNQVILDVDTAVRKYNSVVEKNELLGSLLHTAKNNKLVEAYRQPRPSIKIDTKA